MWGATITAGCKITIIKKVRLHSPPFSVESYAISVKKIGLSIMLGSVWRTATASVIRTVFDIVIGVADGIVTVRPKKKVHKRITKAVRLQSSPFGKKRLTIPITHAG